MIANIKAYWQFYGSLLLGVIIWGVTYIMLPVEIVEPFKLKTLTFIILSYLMIIAGFCFFNFKIKPPVHTNQAPYKIIKILLFIVIISHLIRWYDLFVIRELSFANEFRHNRYLNDFNYHKIGALLIIASIFKSIYFFPFVLCIRARIKPKSILAILSYLCLLLPIIEAFLKGNRKPMFEIFIIVIFTLILFVKKLNVKKGSVIFLVFILLMTLSMTMLFKRESKTKDLNNAFYSRVLESRYNDLLMPKEHVKSFFNDNTQSNIKKFYAFTFLHTGQYITHGVFEFNHIMDYKDLPITKGEYTFVTVPKLINKTKLFNKITYKDPSPRQYVYLTTFGGLYIDFRWATLAFMFVFGAVQKYIYQKSMQSFIYTPILIYFLIINVFLLIINYMRGAGIYPFIASAILILILKIAIEKQNEKSISS